MKLVEKDGFVLIDDHKVEGFVSDKHCLKCDEKVIYSEKFDSYFCATCNVWLEDHCPDNNCKYCVNRPPKPVTKPNIEINLQGVNDKNSLFEKLDEKLIIQEWGHNWDALNDCLRDLDTGGFTNKYEFPLSIKITNWKQFESDNSEEFNIFKEVMKNQANEHKNNGKELTVSFE